MVNNRHPMAAKYPGQCYVCGMPFEAGAEIIFFRTTGKHPNKVMGVGCHSVDEPVGVTRLDYIPPQAHTMKRGKAKSTGLNWLSPSR